ncbi:MAG: hypothetical protein LBF72_04190 [Holosporales bacterium]|nr:hypothetical protein [Holosporales bacterium]
MILSELGTTPVPIEILFNHHNCDLPTLLAAIGELELEGRIKRNTKNEIFLATQSQKV